tara:strand:- start:1059 stop:1316 length:258 start_codon:yes stop_codon:yes gene_type:complete
MAGQNDNNSQQGISIESLKDWFSFIAAVMATVAAVIFWVQTSSDSKFEKVESQISRLRSDIDKIQTNNNEILRIIGRLEGKLDSD